MSRSMPSCGQGWTDNVYNLFVAYAVTSSARHLFGLLWVSFQSCIHSLCIVKLVLHSLPSSLSWLTSKWAQIRLKFILHSPCRNVQTMVAASLPYSLLCLMPIGVGSMKRLDTPTAIPATNGIRPYARTP